MTITQRTRRLAAGFIIGGIVAAPATAFATSEPPPPSEPVVSAIGSLFSDEPSDPVEPAPQTYTVQEGDNWVGISTSLGVDLAALFFVNGVNTDNMMGFLEPGLELAIPTVEQQQQFYDYTDDDYTSTYTAGDISCSSTSTSSSSSIHCSGGGEYLSIRCHVSPVTYAVTCTHHDSF